MNLRSRIGDRHQGSQVVDNILTYYFVETLGFEFVNLAKITQTATITATKTETTIIYSDTLTVTKVPARITETDTVTVTKENQITETVTVTEGDSIDQSQESNDVPTDSVNLPLPNLSFFVVSLLLIAGIKSYHSKFLD